MDARLGRVGRQVGGRGVDHRRQRPCSTRAGAERGEDDGGEPATRDGRWDAIFQTAAPAGHLSRTSAPAQKVNSKDVKTPLAIRPVPPSRRE